MGNKNNIGQLKVKMKWKIMKDEKKRMIGKRKEKRKHWKEKRNAKRMKDKEWKEISKTWTENER